MLILVLGTHVGKLNAASTLVLSRFLGASCSWDELTHGRPLQLDLNIP
jgi:hypothetical protein